MACSAKECIAPRSWLKSYGSVCVNRSVDRRTFGMLARAPVRPGGRSAVPSAVPVVLFCKQSRGAPLGLPQEQSADPGDGHETERRAGGARQ